MGEPNPDSISTMHSTKRVRIGLSHCVYTYINIIYSYIVNGSNRWYGKALQFIIAKSGEVCISNEHSFCEAVPAIALADDILDRIKQNEYNDQVQSSMMPDINHIPFNINTKIEEEIEAASKKLNK